jgi:hypothetical protein
MGSLAVSTCKTSVFLIVLVSRTTSELGEKGTGDGVDGTNDLVTVVVVVVTMLFSKSSLPISLTTLSSSKLIRYHVYVRL